MTKINVDQNRPSKRILSAVLAAALSATGLLAGCTNKPAEPPASTDQGSNQSAVGDLLTVAIPAPATGINPASVNTSFSDFAGLAYEPLLRRDGKGGYQGALAETWKVAEGNLAVEITLREGMKFADDTPVNAAAVKASLEYCASEKSINRQTLQSVKSIEVADERKLTINMSQPNPLIEYLLTDRQGCGMIISPAGLAKIDTLTVDNPSEGGGPYIYQPKESVPGDSYTYTANPNYWDKPNQHYKKIVLKVIPQSQAALNALTTGQVDVASGDLATAKQAKAANIQLAWTPFVWAGLNLIDRKGETTPALGDLKVRQAINYAINREAITTALLGEFGVATDQPSAEGFDGWSQEAKDAYPYDVAKAKELMAQSSYPNGFELPVITVAFAGLDVLTKAITPMLAEIGITVKETVATDEKTYLEGMTSKKYSAAAVGYGSGPMFLMGMALVLPTAVPFNGFGTNDPQALTLLQNISTATGEKQTTAAQELNLYLVKQAWFAPVAFTPVLYYARQGIGGVEVSGKHPTVSVRDIFNK